jgi:hypothetical protein
MRRFALIFFTLQGTAAWRLPVPGHQRSWTTDHSAPCFHIQCRTAGIHCSGQRLRKRDRVAQTFKGLWRKEADEALELLTPLVDASEQRAIEMAERITALKSQGTATVVRRSAMAKACAEKLAAPRGADLQSRSDAADVPGAVSAAEEVVAHDSVAKDKELDGSMAAAVQELASLLGSNPGWKQLADFHGGRAEGCLVAHLREAAARDGQVDAAAAHTRILKALEYRADNALDRPDVLRSIETARCRSFWPFAFAENALDGSPVEICRLSRLSVPRILSTFPEEEVVHFYGLWCEQTLRLYGKSALADAPTQGSIHVYDCRGVSAHASVVDVLS